MGWGLDILPRKIPGEEGDLCVRSGVVAPV